MKSKLFKLSIILLLLCIPIGINAAKIFDIWSGFQAGELSSYMDGQVGLDEYRFGAKTMTNFIPHVQGPVSNRPGFRYIAMARNEILVVANALKTTINAHAADGGGATDEHATADTVNFPIYTNNATDITAAYSLIGELLTAFNTHESDDDAGAGSYHRGAENDDATLTSTATPTTDLEAVTVLTDLIAKYNIHDADSTTNAPHYDGSTHQESSSNPNGSQKSRLIPFEFSTEQAYMLEFGPLSVRYYMNDGQINTLDSNTMLMLSMNGTDASTTFTDDSPITPHYPVPNGNVQLDTEYKKFGSASGLFDGNADYLVIADNADFDFSSGSLTLDGWFKFTDSSDLSTLYSQHIIGTSTEIRLYITGGQAIFYIMVSGLPTVSLVGTPNIPSGVWTHIAVVLDDSNDNYYLFVNGSLGASTTDTDRPSNYNSFVHIGDWSRYPTAGGELDGAVDEFRVSDSARWTSAFTPETIEYMVSDCCGVPYETTTTYTEAELPELRYVQSADTLFIVHPDHAPATLTRTGHTNWTLADISFNDAPASWAVGSYPSNITFFEERLWYGYFQTIWASQSGDYYNMDPLSVGTCTGDACALQYTIASNNVNEIQWFSSGKILVVGTSGGEYKVSASSQDEAITPTNVRIVKQSSYGSENIMPLTIRDVVLYVQRAGRKVREFSYRFENDTYVSPDLTLLAEHITNSQIKSMAYQPNPDSIVWSVRNDGDLIGMTYARDNDTVAWHHHTTDGDFESVAVIPDTSGSDTDEVWVIVKRDVNGSTVRYVEQLQPRFDHNDSIEDAFFVDSGLSYDGVSTSTISGLDHLEGKTVAILADGTVQTSKTVSGGSITLDTAATKVHAGLPYTSTLQTMRWVGNSDRGTMQGREKRINSIVLRLENAKQFKYGHTPTGTLYERIFPSLFTGDFELNMPGGINREGYVSVLQYEPLPLTITAIIPEVNW